MGDDAPRATDRTPPGTHCEWCGADYDDDAGSREPQAPARRTTAKAPPADEPGLTHCEWCGAEYPTPGPGAA